MATGAVSGRYGDVKIGSTQVCDVQKWSFSPKVEIHSYASNCTNQAKVKIVGVKDGTGTIDGLYNPADPIMATLDVGTSVTLKLYITATVFYSIPAIIDSLKVDVDIDSGNFVTWAAGFQSSGAWTNPIAGLTAARPVGVEPEPEEEIPVDPNYRSGAPTARMSEERVAELVHAQLTMARSEMMTMVAEVAANAAIAAVDRYLAHMAQTSQAA